ncbi:hypothetical protein [Nodosilinea sp. P-1105]|uniref:hypothetical protein n=1 Tax=Nodosilinea sp. P-1105 TaxID=2546229 RepID=UPI00146A07DE|nr:hypothetical protein [Nodosilinea sp. P-1105]NMF83713.1 hypothetical protein [Nodosilinea sp. P-1105]
MLCSSCENQSHCLPAQLATRDSHLEAMLGQLQSCNVKSPATPRSPQRTGWRGLVLRLQRLWRGLRGRVMAWWT